MSKSRSALALTGRAGTLARWGRCDIAACVKSVEEKECFFHGCRPRRGGVVLVLQSGQRVGVLAQRQASGEGGEGRAGGGVALLRI